MYRSRIISSNLSIKSIIKSLDFFSTLNDEDVDLLASISSINSYSKDYILHYEKKESNSLLFLVDGLAKSYKIDKHDNEIFLYYIYKESMLSEISDITSDTLYSFSNIELLEESHILTIDYQQFRNNFLNKHIPDLRQKHHTDNQQTP
ncbi:MAG: hypothetical protein U9Q29_09420 [Campylobacterota bacterium]|nr:hypothetical protein [Campylobacterota bacterium]